MDFFSLLFERIDILFIAPYRWPGNPYIGWWLGTLLMGIWCTLFGEMTLALAVRINRSRVKEVTEEVMEYHQGSINALKAGDKTAFKAINRLANEAYGKTFFLQISMACASLWPVALALGWMQTRFSGVDFSLPFQFPIIGRTVSYPFVFIPLYILVRIMFREVKGIFYKDT